MDKIETGSLNCPKAIRITFLVVNYDENKAWHVAAAQLLKLSLVANWVKGWGQTGQVLGV